MTEPKGTVSIYVSIRRIKITQGCCHTNLTNSEVTPTDGIHGIETKYCLGHRKFIDRKLELVLPTESQHGRQTYEGNVVTNIGRSAVHRTAVICYNLYIQILHILCYRRLRVALSARRL